MPKLKMRWMIVLCLGIIHGSWAQQWGATLHLAQDSVMLGDRFVLSVDVIHPQEAQVELPGWPSVLAPLDVLDWQVAESSEGVEKGWKKKTWTATARSFEAGDQTLGPVAVEGVLDKDTTRLDVSPVSVVVLPRLADSILEIMDVIPPMADPHWPLWVWVVLGALFLGLLVWLLYKKRKQTLAIEQPILPPYEEALQALQALQARALLQSGEQAEYFAELGLIVRRYLQRRFLVEVLDATSHELKQRLAHVKGLPQAYRESTLRFAAETDLVKFARANMESDKALNWEEWAARLLEDTKPKPVAAESEAN